MKRSRRLMLFGLLVILLIASIVYSRAVRRLQWNADLQYVPKENELLVVTSEIVEVWEAVDRHFGEVIATGEEEGGAVAAWFAQLREIFDEREIPVRSLADLSRHGIDAKRPTVFSVGRIPLDGNLLGIVPVIDGDAFAEFFAAFVESEFDGQAQPIGGVPVKSMDDGNVLLAFPEPGLATFTITPLGSLPLERSLGNRAGNRAYAMQDDALFDALRRRLTRTLGRVPSLFAFWRPTSLPPLAQVAAGVSFHDNRIGIELDVKADRSGLSVVDDIMRASTPTTDWPRLLPSGTAAAIVLDDPAAATYLRLASESEELDEAMERDYVGVLAGLRGVSSLRRLLFAWTGQRDGLPEWIIGASADPRELEQMVQDLQIRNRESRDRSILEQAVAIHPATVGDRVPSAADLLASGLLQDEPHALFERYTIVRDPEEPDRIEITGGELHAADFDNPAYVSGELPGTMRYILPPITGNDLRYTEALKDLDPESATRDEYRIATLLAERTLWIASDAEQLGALARRAGSEAPGLSRDPAFLTASASWDRSAKIRGFVDVDRLTVLGLLSPESGIQEQVRMWLLDLRDHPAIAFHVTPSGDERLALSIRLYRRSALVSE